MDDENKRHANYAHLLQPIRDLAANWDIDVASELEEYLVRSHLAPEWSNLPAEEAPTAAT